MPSPRTSDTNGAGHHGDGGMDLRTAVSEIVLLPTPRVGGTGVNESEMRRNSPNLETTIALLPTPAVNDMGAAYTPEEWDAWTAEMKAKHNNGNGHGKSLNVEVQRLLPTPTRRDHKDTEVRREPHRPDDVDTLARALTDVLLPSAVNLLPTPMAGDAKMARNSTAERRSEPPTGIHAGDTLGDIGHADRWGEYGPAIRRWEALTRPAPEPTRLNTKGNPKLSDEFDEWLMGLPAGWITDVPGVTWNETLKACGNGVVPAQCVAALHFLRGMAS